MMHHLLRGWLMYAGKEQVMQAASQAARQYMQNRSGNAGSDAGFPPAEVGVVFALPQEMGCFEDRLTDSVRGSGNKLTVLRGMLQGHSVVAVQSGVGQEAAAHATEALIRGHHPPLVISAGFCGGLHPQLKRNHVLLANEVLDLDGGTQAIGLKITGEAAELATLHVGKLLTVKGIVRTAEEKQALAARHGAVAVDMETAAVLAVCTRLETPMLAVRVVSDTSSETLPPEVYNLVKQKSTSGQLGAAFGALFRRPGSIKDMYQLKENALLAADALAKFLENVILELPPPPAEEPPQAAT